VQFVSFILTMSVWATLARTLCVRDVHIDEPAGIWKWCSALRCSTAQVGVKQWLTVLLQSAQVAGQDNNAPILKPGGSRTDHIPSTLHAGTLAIILGGRGKGMLWEQVATHNMEANKARQRKAGWTEMERHEKRPREKKLVPHAFLLWMLVGRAS